MARSCTAVLVACLMPAAALAGAQYTAEDVIRYFEERNAAAAPDDRSLARSDPGDRGIVIGGPAAAKLGLGGAAGTEAPLVIPLTGAKAGNGVPPAAAPAAAPASYDLMVTFELDSATLTPQARQNLDAFARALRSPALAGLSFAVEGHTDATGSPQHNQELSERRAASVVSYLVGHGVDAARLTAAGYGEARPRVADPAHPENRRVETRRVD